MDLTVGEVSGAGDLGVVPGIAQVSNVHGYHGSFLFFSVQIPACQETHLPLLKGKGTHLASLTTGYNVSKMCLPLGQRACVVHKDLHVKRVTSHAGWVPTCSMRAT